MKNRCFNSSLSEKDLADLAFNGLRSYLKEKLEGTWKMNVPKLQGRRANQGPTFGQLLNKYTKAVQQDRPLKKRPRSPPHRDNASPPRREFISHRGDHPQFPPHKVYATMPWSPPASNAVNPVWEHEGIWLQCFPMPYPPPHQREIGRS